MSTTCGTTLPAWLLVDSASVVGPRFAAAAELTDSGTLRRYWPRRLRVVPYVIGFSSHPRA